MAFADAVEALLDDPDRRAAMGAEGRRRIEASLGWPHQAEAYRGVYERLLGPASPASPTAPEAPTSVPGPVRRRRVLHAEHGVRRPELARPSRS